MRVSRVEWEGAAKTALSIRELFEGFAEAVDVAAIEREVSAEGNAAVLRLTAEFDATERPPESLRVEPAEAEAALAAVEPPLREAMEVAVTNIRAVAEAQLTGPARVELPQGQVVTVREVPVRAAGIYAPGGRAAYPSSVLMCAIPAQVAGVERISLASPPGRDGRLHPLALAAAALCGIEEIYAMGGAQAIFALAYGTETIAAVDVVAGPGNAWVREAKRAIAGRVGIDSLAGPSELMLVAGHDTDPRWAALDLCAQAEHGPDSPLVVVAVERAVLDAIEAATASLAERPSVANAPLALVQVPDLSDAIEFANAFAPEHLELLEEDAALLADRVRTAGCVFAGRHAATAFGDYVAGSNHVLPTGGAGRFAGPLGPGTFMRKIAEVEVAAAAAAALAPHVDALARAEGFPVHGESAMIRR
ncbi:MAG TPA: histidinol dehydrogenase [Solirubrobacterales bacterium]|jgi:histidinol dehydrogenase|nr:histidinol dehydrogenase [Solirubrobacterales bacterium]